ncbi:hypothetical protein T439DRAFT_347745 [Meredithblackwellia eburnea MCA 4105]
MRIPLNISTELDLTNTPGLPPLAFIDNEPFLVELQGALELPGQPNPDEGLDQYLAEVNVGKLDTTDPSKPVLQVAHHRLEGRLVTLSEPYAILRTTRPESSSAGDAEAGGGEKESPLMDIIGVIKKKMVFAKRPEPIITLSSEADIPES